MASLLGLVLVGAAAPGLAQQNPFVPYYGKNLIHYGNFDWKIYRTDHFEIFYYGDVAKHLERIAGYAESAYQTVSSDLKHDLPIKVPLILFKTHMDFEQENVIPGAVEEGVAAFAEPVRNRMLLPIDEPPDLLYRTITHELTHIFEFDIIPQSLIGGDSPLWINEGLSDYETGYWSPLDLATVRDAAVSDIVPKMSKLEGYGGGSNPRLVYDLGHAAFEFIEARWGKEGIRQFLFASRKSVIGGGANAYEEAFRIKADEFDQQFDKYLKERFRPFRDKERPADYGRDLAPSSAKTRYTGAFTAAPSPAGDLVAIVTGNKTDQEYDVILLSARDGSVVRNLTPGFDKDRGFYYLSIPGVRWNTVPWLAWSPNGEDLAYFVRFGRAKGIVIESVKSRKTRHIPLPEVAEPESPCFSPDGKSIAFSALEAAKSDLFLLSLETRQLTRLTEDQFFNFAPTFAPDGRSIVYLARVSGNEKLFRLDLATKKSTQLTFGTHDDSGAQFIDANTIVFSSTATDPNQAVDPDVARNGEIYNIWTLNLQHGELKAYTDTLGANTSPAVLHTGGPGTTVSFVTYFKGQYGIHTLDLSKPIETVATADFGAPGPVIDFQAPLSHTLVAENVRKKKLFEKLFLDGRPSLAVGVTNNGDVFGGTEISMSDVLGDHRIDLTIGAIMQYTTFAASYTSTARRFQWAVQGVYQKLFYYGNNPYYYDPYLQPYLSRDMAEATRTLVGGSVFGIWPFDRYRRLEVSAGVFHQSDSYNNQNTTDLANQYPGAASLGFSGSLVPFSVSFIQETTVFREYGPLSGNTVRVSYEVAPHVGGLLSRQTIDGDLRYYQRIFGNTVLAMRLRGLRSWGDYPNYDYFGGMSDMRGYDYLEFVGQNIAFGNVELRVPIFRERLSKIGVYGGLRGVVFFDIGAGWFDGQGFKFAASSTETRQRVTGVLLDANGFPILDANGQLQPVFDPPITISGFRLQDARASYGFGLETFIIGIPLHFDLAWRTTFNKAWEDYLFGVQGADAWRKPRFSFWIGYDF
jgi:hypothetical protein